MGSMAKIRVSPDPVETRTGEDRNGKEPTTGRLAVYRTIMVPLDGSALAERALPLAESLAAAGGGRLVLVRAAQAHALPADELEAERQVVQVAEEYLATAAARLDEAQD